MHSPRRSQEQQHCSCQKWQSRPQRKSQHEPWQRCTPRFAMRRLWDLEEILPVVQRNGISRNTYTSQQALIFRKAGFITECFTTFCGRWAEAACKVIGEVGRRDARIQHSDNRTKSKERSCFYGCLARAELKIADLWLLGGYLADAASLECQPLHPNIGIWRLTSFLLNGLVDGRPRFC